MKIALIQQTATDDLKSNRERGLAAAKTAAKAGAKIIGFAELAFDPFYPQRHATEIELAKAEAIPGETTDAFCELAKEHEVVIVLNLFERDGEKTFDTSPVIDADGTILGSTRMIHITDYEHFYEQGFYAEGDHGAPVFDTRYGKVGVSICYDRHFPEFMRALALNGAEIVFIPQAGALGEWPEGLYEAELQVAAFQNGYFTALVNRVGKEEFLTFGGESFVCNPSGKVIAQANKMDDEILYCEIDLTEVQSSHARQLFLKHRRPDLYGDWLSK